MLHSAAEGARPGRFATVAAISCGTLRVTPREAGDHHSEQHCDGPSRATARHVGVATRSSYTRVPSPPTGGEGWDEALTITANEFLGVDPFLKVVTAVALVFMTFAMVGLATGLGARYPRFGADPNEVAGSYGGVAFMILAVLFIIVTIALLGWSSALYLIRRLRAEPLTLGNQLGIAASFGAVAAMSIATWLLSMRSGIRALEAMRE
jgi:hypothetical protein